VKTSLPEKPGDGSGDAGRKEILYYSGGGIGSDLTTQFLSILHTLLIIALGLSPLLLGVLLSVKTLWAALCDPIIAHLSDHARTRWGRRHPFIFYGSITRLLVLIAMIAFFPKSQEITPNKFLAAQDQQSQAASDDRAEAPQNEKKDDSLLSLSAIKASMDTFLSAESGYKKKVAIYLVVCSLVFTTLGSITNIPYYAMGLELCRSYDGRTRLVAYRAVIGKITDLITPWILPFCLLPMFHNFLDGLFWYASFTVAIALPTTILMLRKTRERPPLPSANPQPTRPPLLKSIWMTARNIHFLKILLLYQFFGYAIGVFAQLGIFLNIYYVYSGNALAGATLDGYIATFATVLTFAALPLFTWSCHRFQKHRALRFTIIWMSLGMAFRWFLITPDHPFLQLFLPFFFSLGISTFYLILSTMMADVADIDELRHGLRREAMFGAVMGFCMKLTGTLQPILAGAVLVASGFDISLGGNQSPETFTNMRLLFSFIPAGLLLFGLLILWRYPLTREYTGRLKQLLNEARPKSEPTGV